MKDDWKKLIYEDVDFDGVISDYDIMENDENLRKAMEKEVEHVPYDEDEDDFDDDLDESLDEIGDDYEEESDDDFVAEENDGGSGISLRFH